MENPLNQPDAPKPNWDEQVEEAFGHLLQTYLATKHRKKTDVITRAFHFAKHAHQGVKRLSGEPYIMHPLAVAQITCSEIGLGSTSICAALLHDVVEDTDYTVEDIENMFGHKVAQIVDGLTKIAGGIFGDNASAQAENFKKLLLTMSEDIRVILIKIADRLHNMRTLAAQPKNKQYKIAGETLYIYAPLANRLGLNAIKNELEDLSFHYEHPREYDEITDKLRATQTERLGVFEEFTAPIRQQLDQRQLRYDIKARIKTPYSIWQKMQTKHIPFEEVFDILAVRIVFQPTSAESEQHECFDIYVELCKIYKSHPDRFRDWVNHPKSNGYQALHVTLMSGRGEWIEVQIRSTRMDEIAEKGFAAHWKYKEGAKTESESETELDKWLTTIKEILDDPQPDAMDFLSTIKLNLYASEIFVFTPKGELRRMPAGSTVLDFAFSIHTFVGCHCIGAKVNHKLATISHKLQSGDQVEILTSNSQQLKRNWLDICTTAKARTKILGVLRKEDRDARKKGEQLLREFFEKHDVPHTITNIDKLCRAHSCYKPDLLYLDIGYGKFTLGDMDLLALRGKNGKRGFKFSTLFGKKDRTTPTPVEGQQQPAAAVVDTPVSRKQVLTLTEEGIHRRYAIASCCQPIPGDPVLAYLDDDNQILVHQVRCNVATRLKANHGNRILAAAWEPIAHRTLLFPASIYMEGIDRLGLLNEITRVISHDLQVNMHKLNVECVENLFKCQIQLFVHDATELRTAIQSIRKIKDIKSVARV